MGNNAIKLTNHEVAKINIPIILYSLHDLPLKQRLEKSMPNFICGTVTPFSLHIILREILISHTLIWIRAIIDANIKVSVNQFFAFFNLTFVSYLEYFLKKINGTNHLKPKKLEIEIRDETNFSIKLTIITGPPFYKKKQEKILRTFYSNEIFNDIDTSNKECLAMELDL